MILVDTSVWIDHVHERQEELVRLLEADEVCTHPFVVEELAMGRLTDRHAFLSSLRNLRNLGPVSHDELMALIDARSLWGIGLDPGEAHLLAAVVVTPGTTLWTRDKRLRVAAERLGVAHT